jgi:NitT/TauT family transport system substrate-binding protein
LPVNVAAKLHASNPQLLVTGAVTGLGMLSVVTRDTTITRLTDLEGKTIFVAGQGATPEYVLRTLLKKAGLGTVIPDFSLSAADIAAALASGRISLALLPEPFTTLALERDSLEPPLYRALSLTRLWKEYGFGDDFPMTVCVIRRNVAEQYPAEVAAFLESYRQSILWTMEHPADASRCAQEADLGLLASVAEEAIPHCGFTFIPAREAKPFIDSLLSVYLDYAPAAIGRKLPDRSFYLE